MNIYIYLLLALLILLILTKTKEKENFSISYNDLSKGFLCNKGMDETAFNNYLCKNLTKDIDLNKLSKLLIDNSTTLMNKHLGHFNYNICPDEFTKMTNTDYNIVHNYYPIYLAWYGDPKYMWSNHRGIYVTDVIYNSIKSNSVTIKVNNKHFTDPVRGVYKMLIVYYYDTNNRLRSVRKYENQSLFIKNIGNKKISHNSTYKEYNNTNFDNCKNLMKKDNYAGFTIDKFNKCSLRKQFIKKDKIIKKGVTTYISGGSTQFTISYWINIKAVYSRWRRIFLAGNGSDNNRCPGIYIYPNSTGIHFRCSTETNSNDGLDINNGEISLDKWTHITTVLYGKEIKHYVDGVLKGTKSLASLPNFNNNVILQIGGGNKYNNNNVNIAQFRIFSIAVPEIYIKNVLLNASPNINCKTLKNIPKFCENSVDKNKYIDTYIDDNDTIIDSQGSHSLSGSISNKRGIRKDFPNYQNRTVRLLGLADGVHYKSTYLAENTARQPSVKRFLTNNLIILSGRCLVNDSQKIIAYLPIDYRPNKRLVFHRLEKIGIRVDIYPDGRIERVAGHLKKGEFSFDGLKFNKDTGNQIDFSIKRGCRYVRLLLPKHDYLNIAEVEVYDNLGINIAQGKTATQSSYYGGKSGSSRINPLNALDGNTSGLYGKGDSISHTGYGSNQWWMVDLGEVHNVSKVVVYNRADKCCDQRIAGAKIQLLDINKHEIISQTWDPNDFIKTSHFRNHNKTKSGRKCQNWEKQIPHKHTRTSQNYPNKDLGNHNYCRNPDNESGDWCYTQDPKKRWELCKGNYKNLKINKVYPNSKTFSFKQSSDGRISTDWKNYKSVYREGSYSIIDNDIYLSGLVKYTGGHIYRLPCIIGQLPKNCCPKSTHLFNVSNHIGTATIEVDTDGIIRITKASEVGVTARRYHWISLDGINWNISNHNIDIKLESSWKNLGSTVNSDLMSGNILNINLFKGNGIDNGYSLGNLSKFKITGNQTIAMFIKADSNGRQNPIAKAYGGEGTLTIEPNGSITYYYGNSGQNNKPYQGFNSKKTIKWGVKTHIAVVRDTTKKKLIWYIDGLKTNEITMTLIPVESHNDLLIGKGYVKEFKGVITSLLLFNRVLTINDISQLSKSEGLVGKNYASPKVIKNNEYISLQGVVGPKNTNYKGTIITKLKNDLRPNKDLTFYINGNGKSNKILVSQNGNITFLEGEGDIVSLDGISFMTYK